MLRCNWPSDNVIDKIRCEDIFGELLSLQYYGCHVFCVVTMRCLRAAPSWSNLIRKVPRWWRRSSRPTDNASWLCLGHVYLFWYDDLLDVKTLRWAWVWWNSFRNKKVPCWFCDWVSRWWNVWKMNWKCVNWIGNVCWWKWKCVLMIWWTWNLDFVLPLQHSLIYVEVWPCISCVHVWDFWWLIFCLSFSMTWSGLPGKLFLE